MPPKTISAKEAFGDRYAKSTPFHSPKFRDSKEAAAAKPTAPETAEVEFEVREMTDYEKLNKLEKSWYSELLESGNCDWIGIQNITFKLGDDCRYTPDFVVIRGGKMIAYECKGFMRDDALVKLKTAARRFTWLQFIVVKYENCEFVQTEVKP